jgi:hypothetical protein
MNIQVGLPARGKSYLSNKLMRYLKVQFDLKYLLRQSNQLQVARI